MRAVTDDNRLLTARWRPLLPSHPELGADLARRYADPARRYHGVRHLHMVLDGVDELGGEAAEPRLVALAAWFHDAVYDVLRDDNEERSARLAETVLAGAGTEAADVGEVARLVRLTASHDPAEGDRNGAVLCDADLAILAGDAAVYASYVSAVRAEYAHVGDGDFRRARAALLERLVARPALFRTPLGHTRWEFPARLNIDAELTRLR